MNLINQMDPCYEKLTGITDSKEFVQSFCQKALTLLDEFKSEYSNAMTKRKIKDLDAITHKISSTMNWLDLGEFVSLIKSYKNMTTLDKTARETLLTDVTQSTNYIEDCLQRKIAEQ